MATTYTFPTAAELMEIEQSLLPVLTADDPVFSILPMEDVDTDVVMWEQEDDWFGLQQVRGLNGEPGKVNRVGVNRYRMEPGVYGEFAEVDEAELVKRRVIGSFNQPISISDLVRKLQEHLLHRRLTRIKQIAWDLLTTGTFSVSNAAGSVTHTDTYTLQTLDASDWGTTTTSTPLADFRAAQLKSHGYSVKFDSKAKAYMNRTTWNQMIACSTATDLGGRRTAGLASVENISDLNKILMGDDLPEVVVYDEGYKNNAGTWVNYIPTDYVVVVGNRNDHQPIGSYAMTRNAGNPDMAPGSYTHVIDSADHGMPIPRKIWVHDGHNGGPKLTFPSAVVLMDVR